MLPCHCKPKIYLRFFEVCTTPGYTILDSRLPSCYAISEGRPLLSNTSSETGALPLEVRIKNDLVLIFSKSKFVHSYLETTFLHVSSYHVIVSRKYIFGFSKSAPTPRFKILNWRFPLVMRSRKAGLSLAKRAWKQELCP